MCISITNGFVTDSGFSIMCEYLLNHELNENPHKDLKVIRIYNNIMSITTNNEEIPFLMTSTRLLANALDHKLKLTTFELHGFFFN